MYVPPLHSSPGGATDVMISNSFPRSTWQEATSHERRPAIREVTEVVGIFCLLCLVYLEAGATPGQSSCNSI